MPTALELLHELSITIEIVFSKNDHILSKMPNEAYINSLSQSTQQNSRQKISHLERHYANDILQSKYWTKSGSLTFINNFSVIVSEVLEGTCYIGTTFIENTLDVFLPVVRSKLDRDLGVYKE